MSYIPPSGFLQVLDDLSDVNSVTTSRNNLSLGAAQVVAFGGIDLVGTGGNGHVYIPRQSPLSTVTAPGLGIQCNNSDQAVFGTQAYSRCILDFSSLSAGDKTFTFPNTTGTLALTENLASVGVLSVVPGIDGKTIAVTDLYTVPAGKTCYVIGVMIKMTNANNVTGAGIAGVRRASDANTIINGVTMTGLDVTDECFWMIPSLGTSSANTLFVVPAADKVQFNLFTAFTATTATLEFHVLGYNL